MNCPKCQLTKLIQYGQTDYGKPRFCCPDFGRQFVENLTRQAIARTTRQLIEKLLLKRRSLAGIARVRGVSERSLQMYINQKIYATSETVDIAPKKKGNLPFSSIECGHLLAPRIAKQEWDSPLMSIVVKWLGSCLGIVFGNQRSSFGHP